MKNILKLVIAIALLIIPLSQVKAETIANRLKGKILLQVESRGEAYYVHPTSSKAYYMADGNEAYTIMRDLGIGITNKDLDNITTNKTFAKKYSGKIFLQVESHGEAYYIDFNGEAHYLKDGAAAYSIMRSLGLGITNKDLEKVSVDKKVSSLTTLPNSILQDNSSIIVKTEAPIISNNLECNGKYWLPCKNEQKFYCPPSGDAVCNHSDNEIKLSNEYKNDLVTVQNKLNEKFEQRINYGVAIKNLYASRISYLNGLSDSNINLLNSSDNRVNQLVYKIGEYYDSAINNLEKDVNNINNAESAMKNYFNSFKDLKATVELEDFIDKITYEKLIKMYIDDDEFLTSSLSSLSKNTDSFNSYIKDEDDMVGNYWALLQEVDVYENKKATQDKIQAAYINQINSSNNYFSSSRPIYCNSTLFSGTINTISTTCH